jgi:hypothetical protein
MKLNNMHLIIFLIVILLFSLFFAPPTIEGLTNNDFETSFNSSYSSSCVANGGTLTDCNQQAETAYLNIIADCSNITDISEFETCSKNVVQGMYSLNSASGTSSSNVTSVTNQMGDNDIISGSSTPASTRSITSTSPTTTSGSTLSATGQGSNSYVSNLFNPNGVNTNTLSAPIPGSNIFTSGSLSAPISSSSVSSSLSTSDYSSSYSPGLTSTTSSASPSSMIIGPGGQQILATTQNTIDGIPASQIPGGQEDLYILKSEVVPPVCPACPNVIIDKSMVQKECQPCPPCARCPEPSFDCKKVPNYSLGTANTYLPRPVLNDFSQFGS